MIFGGGTTIVIIISNLPSPLAVHLMWGVIPTGMVFVPLCRHIHISPFWAANS